MERGKEVRMDGEKRKVRGERVDGEVRMDGEERRVRGEGWMVRR